MVEFFLKAKNNLSYGCCRVTKWLCTTTRGIWYVFKLTSASVYAMDQSGIRLVFIHFIVLNVSECKILIQKVTKAFK